LRTCSVRGPGPRARPFAYGLNVFGANHAQRLRLTNFGDEDIRRKLLFLTEGRIESGDDRLLDLRA